MTITPTTLSRIAALAAAAAGLLYIAIQFLHPADVVASLSTGMWVTVHVLSFAMAVLAILGVTGIYLRQVRSAGLLGLIATGMFALFFVLQASFNFAEAFLAPLIATSAPQLAVDLVGLFGRYPAVTDLGPLVALPLVGSALYVGGALLLGITVLRARVLSRGAGILLIVAAALTPVAGALLPHTLERGAAIPMGLALIWLGRSLWTSHRENGADTSRAGSADLDRVAAA
jgi:hypothetical protein